MQADFHEDVYLAIERGLEARTLNISQPSTSQAAGAQGQREGQLAHSRSVRRLTLLHSTATKLRQP